MEWLLQTFPFLADIDQATYVSIGIYCSWASYVLKGRLENAAWLVFLYPLFLVLSFLAYGAFMTLELFNPKQHREWIVFVVTSAAIGCGLGISLVGLLRRMQERIVERQYQRQLVVRAEEDREKAEQHQRAMSAH